MQGTPTEMLRTTDLDLLGSRVRAAREARGMTQTQLAGDDISVGYVSRIEAGARRPTMRVLTQIAATLALPLEELLEGGTKVEFDEIRLALEYAELSLEVGETAEAESHARRSTERAAQADNLTLEQRGRYLLGRALEAAGELNDAIPQLERAIAGPPGIIGLRAAIALCRCYRDAGDISLAVSTGEAAEASLTELGLLNTDEAVQLAMTVASAYAVRGDLNRALRRCTEALGLVEHLSSPSARGAAYWNASAFREMQGDMASALPLAQRALAHFREGSDARNLARLRLQVGRLQLMSDEPDISETLAHLEATREALLESSASAIDVAQCDAAIADAYLMAGDPSRATEVAKAAEATVGDDALVVRAELLILRGRAATAVDQREDALATFQEAATMLSALGVNRLAAELWFELAELFEELGNADADSRAAFRNAAAASGVARRHRDRSRASSPAARRS